MQKKPPTSNFSFESLKTRIKANLDQVDKLAQLTPNPGQFKIPGDPAILEDLIAACSDTAFWKNFRKAAPIMFCVAVEIDKNLRLMRDMSFFEELMKTNQILHLL